MYHLLLIHLFKIFPKITGLCNDTAVCGPKEFCSATGTNYGESKGICQTGNITGHTILVFALHYIQAINKWPRICT